MNSRVYRTIVADPPWEYPEGFARGVATGVSPNSRRDSWAVPCPMVTRTLPYSSLTVDEIAALPVNDFAGKDARVFLWTTNRYLPDSFRVLAAWGFAYRQMLVWRKYETAPFGGSVAPNTAEFVLVGVRGKPARLRRMRSAVFDFPAVRLHSTKPDAFLDLVEQVSPGPYLEMFARRNRLGWDTWGNEALNHVEVAS